MLAPAGPDRQHYEPVSSAAPPNASSLPWPSGALTLAATTAANGQQATGWITEARGYFKATNTGINTVTATQRRPMVTQRAEGDRRKGDDRQRRLAGAGDSCSNRDGHPDRHDPRALPHSNGKDGMEANAVT